MRTLNLMILDRICFISLFFTLKAGLVEYNQSMAGWWKGGFNVGFSVTDGQTKSKTRYIPVHLTGKLVSPRNPLLEGIYMYMY